MILICFERVLFLVEEVILFEVWYNIGYVVLVGYIDIGCYL